MRHCGALKEHHGKQVLFDRSHDFLSVEVVEVGLSNWPAFVESR
jgi:hypothetical protein